MRRAFANVLTNKVAETAGFYQRLLGMTVRGDFGWFVVLGHPDMPALEFGVLDRGHETLPSGDFNHIGGGMMTFVVDDVETIHRAAQAMQATILQPPTDMPYGQRRLLLRDPAGTLVDVSAPVAG